LFVRWYLFSKTNGAAPSGSFPPIPLDLPAYDDWKRTVRKRAAFGILSVVLIGAAMAAL